MVLLSPYRLLSQEPAAAALILSALAVWFDYAVVPALNAFTPPLVLLLTAVLVLRSGPTKNMVTSSRTAAGLEIRGLLLFAAAHITFLVGFSTSRVFLSPNSGALAAIAKYTVLAPTALLLPWSAWMRLLRDHRAECIAGVLALLTLYPQRLFTMAWPWYAEILGHTAYALSRPLVSGLSYVAHPDPQILGSSLDVTILFWCSGLRGLVALQIVFALMLMLDWPALNRRRALVAYFVGSLIIMAANVLRVVLVVVIGNRFSSALVARYHMAAGWVFFGLIIAACAWCAFGWLTAKPQEGIRVQRAVTSS